MNWKDWNGKKVFIRTIHDRVYSGIVKDVDYSSPPIIWITLLDKFNMLVQFTSSEIAQIKEEA